MAKTLVIAEKPSVAQDIVKALTPVAGRFEKHDEHFESERFVVTSAVGHLVEIQAPEEFDVKRGKWSFAHLPVIPPYFDLKPVDRTKARLDSICPASALGKLLNDDVASVQIVMIDLPPLELFAQAEQVGCNLRRLGGGQRTRA